MHMTGDCSYMTVHVYNPHSSRRTDAIHTLGMAGIADLQEVKKWIGTCTVRYTYMYLYIHVPIHVHLAAKLCAQVQ